MPCHTATCPRVTHVEGCTMAGVHFTAVLKHCAPHLDAWDGGLPAMPAAAHELFVQPPQALTAGWPGASGQTGSVLY